MTFALSMRSLGSKNVYKDFASLVRRVTHMHALCEGVNNREACFYKVRLIIHNLGE